MLPRTTRILLSASIPLLAVGVTAPAQAAQVVLEFPGVRYTEVSHVPVTDDANASKHFALAINPSDPPSFAAGTNWPVPGGATTFSGLTVRTPTTSDRTFQLQLQSALQHCADLATVLQVDRQARFRLVLVASMVPDSNLSLAGNGWLTVQLAPGSAFRCRLRK